MPSASKSSSPTRVPVPSTSRGDSNGTPKFVSENGTPPPSPSSRASPANSEASSDADPENTCAICLGKPANKSFTDVCMHPFCFTCLVEWSKVKPTCPLCQQPFRTIVHNIKENYTYEQYHIFQHFRPGSTSASGVPRNPGISFPTTSLERRGIYEMGYYARLNNTRYRDTSPEFYYNNLAQTHRLIPWLNRELVALLHTSDANISVVLELILGLITRYGILSPEMRSWLDAYLRPFTTHFQHEFYCFASSPHDMAVYDRHVEYEYQPPLSYQEAVERIRRTFEREPVPSRQPETQAACLRPERSSGSAFRPWSPQPGPSGVTISTPSTSTGQSTAPNSNPVVFELSSDSDDDDDCLVVGIVRPFRERSPITVDLCDDSSSQSTISECSTIPINDQQTPQDDENLAAAAKSQESSNGSDCDPDRPGTSASSSRPKSIIGAYYPGGSGAGTSRAHHKGKRRLVGKKAKRSKSKEKGIAKKHRSK